MVDDYHLLVGLEGENVVILTVEAKKTPEKRLLKRSLRRWLRGMRSVRPL